MLYIIVEPNDGGDDGYDLAKFDNENIYGDAVNILPGDSRNTPVQGIELYAMQNTYYVADIDTDEYNIGGIDNTNTEGDQHNDERNVRSDTEHVKVVDNIYYGL